MSVVRVTVTAVTAANAMLKRVKTMALKTAKPRLLRSRQTRQHLHKPKNGQLAALTLNVHKLQLRQHLRLQHRTQQLK